MNNHMMLLDNHTMLSDIHRNVLASQEENNTQNRSVSITCYYVPNKNPDRPLDPT